MTISWRQAFVIDSFYISFFFLISIPFRISNSINFKDDYIDLIS